MPLFSVRKSLSPRNVLMPVVFPFRISPTARHVYFCPSSVAIIGSCAVWFSADERFPATFARANMRLSFFAPFSASRPTSRSIARSSKSCLPASLFA